MERKTAVFSSYIRLFKQADKYDVFMMLLGSIGSLINGFSLPVMYIIQSHVYNGYAKQVNGGLIHKNSNKQVLFCLYLAVVTFIGAYLEVSCWIYTGHRQAGRLRIKYVSSVLRQDTTYFDTQCSSAEVINNVSTDIVHVQEAIGEKLGHLIENVFLFVGSFIASMILTWRLTIMFIPFTLVLLMPGFMYSRALSSYANQRQTSYAEAGKIAEQAISSVRLVYSFVAEGRTWESFSSALEKSTKADKMQGLAKGLTLGLHGLRYFVWALMIWYGGILVLKGEANGAQIFIAGSSFVVGSMALGSVVQNMREVKDGQAALQRIFHVLDKTPLIDIENSKGKFLHKLHGQLEFNNVVFAYPSRPGINVLNGFNLRISPGKTTAIIGGSGSGKSTVVALLERLYDPIIGEVLLDGFNIKHLQLRWYRQQIGLVSQEPVLFSSSIRENILLGKEEATVDEVINAAKLANAHEFIINFPAGYETQVGVRGAQLSGGQKQRIALARAIIRNPAILLLDEATSALDNESERAVKKGMQEVVNNRTTVIVAHKLSAICDADFVAYVELGQVAQFGRLDEFPEMFNELKQLKHVYRLQNIASEKDDEIMEARIDGKPDNTKHGSSSKLVFNRLLMMNKPEWKYCIFGIFGAVCIGFVHPIFVTVGADAITTFYSPNFDKVRSKIRVDAGIFAVLSVISIIVNTVQHYSFGAMGAALTKRVREKMLKNILQCDVSWFDQEKHSCGALTSRLSTSASMVRGIVGDRISILVQTASTLFISLIASFVISWRLAIVLISIQPLILVCFYFRVNNLQDFARKAAGIQEEVSQVVLEGVTQHQTVAAFNSQIRIINVLESRLKTISARAVGLCQVAGMSSGIALFALFSSYGLCLWYGGKLISENKTTFSEFLITFYLLIGTGRSLADILSLTPDIIQGTTVAESIFEILDEQTSVKPTEYDTACDVKLQGRIEFANVTFAYPSRPSYNVLKEFNLTVEACKTVALVGRSGSGKSTAIGLLERFYDPQVGHILVDNVDINDIPVGLLRKHIGLVSQEPTLFACSIRENIAYGKDNATDAEVIQAAQAANAHEFISALPQGYCTFVGEIGVQLSGGQKQRIAIARAILKQPKILLLDEATSALDRKSETAVQAALERAMDGITSIIVAHRISTIVNAHKIAVVREGIVVEQGTYEDLLAKEHHGEFISLLHG